ncbi:hypothetical protein [Thioalkalivibrio sp. XN8]|uniref:hypothetical protein n=1 Tax=Thioalkalivibrio sp. XN8 TaxID=2712863 RepID=UPI0013EB15F9|nr:hypothetical protein [Thioalkalivibrio sp. XN8]NGP53195.1 hypothetical protein [Thioalkalivibrio sp. XN8]
MRSNVTKQMMAAAGLLAMAGMAAAPAAAEQRCPPRCGIDIELPADAAAPPSIPDGQQVVIAVRGAALQVTVTDRRGRPDKAATTLVFQKAGPGEEGQPYTPFVENRGANAKPITEVRLNPSGRTTLFIREDEAHKCFDPPGCKFDIVNEGEAERPVLDPYIIIDR